MPNYTEKTAKEVFQDLCSALDSKNWHYEKREEDLTVNCSVRGEDFPISLVIRIKEKVEIISVLSHLPFKISEDKRVDAAVAISVINEILVHGSFDYNVLTGDIIFRMASVYAGSELTEDAFMYLILVTCNTVDQYNDKLLMLSKGMISLEQFIESAKE